MKYRTLVADPPWEIARRMGAGGRRARATEVPYAFMSIDAICELKPPAAEDAHLFLWATRRVFREGDACRVARAWGFEPCGEIIWGLRNPGMGTPSLANDHEPCLIARRGSLDFQATEPLGVYFWRQPYAMTPQGVPAKVHSAKPEAFLDLVEQVSPGPYLELFARRQRLGWDTYGNEALNHVDFGGVA